MERKIKNFYEEFLNYIMLDDIFLIENHIILIVVDSFRIIVELVNNKQVTDGINIFSSSIHALNF